MVRKSMMVMIGMLLAVGSGPAHASVNLVTNGPNAAVTGFTTIVVAVSKSAPTTYVNGDALALHNVEASSALGPDSNYWCVLYTPGRCPLFWSPLIGVGQSTPVVGLQNAEVGRTYAFRCAPHASMTGLFVITP